MILKDLRISPLRNILTSISMLVGIIAMIGSVLVGTLGKEYLISVNAQIYGWVALLGGLLPAIKAAKLEPALALR